MKRRREESVWADSRNRILRYSGEILLSPYVLAGSLTEETSSSVLKGILLRFGARLLCTKLISRGSEKRKLFNRNEFNINPASLSLSLFLVLSSRISRALESFEVQSLRV